MSKRYCIKRMVFALINIVLALNLSSMTAIPAEGVLCERSNFSEKSLTATRSLPNLHEKKWEDRVSSFRIPGGYWTFYEHINYSGHNVTRGSVECRRIQDIGFVDDTILSRWVASQMPRHCCARSLRRAGACSGKTLPTWPRTSTTWACS